IALQRALPANFSIDLAMVGNHGVAQPAVYNLNAATAPAAVGAADATAQPQFLQFGRKSAANLRYQGFSSFYNSMQVKVNRRFNGGFLVQTAYTWGRAEGYQSEDAGLRFYINPQRNWERLDFDRRHNFALGYVWDLPFV